MSNRPSNDEREIGRLSARVLKLRLVKPNRNVVAHLTPAEGQSATGCCGVDVFELPEHAACLVDFVSQQTCPTSPAPPAEPDPEWWDR